MLERLLRKEILNLNMERNTLVLDPENDAFIITGLDEVGNPNQDESIHRKI